MLYTFSIQATILFINNVSPALYSAGETLLIDILQACMYALLHIRIQILQVYYTLTTITGQVLRSQSQNIVR